MSHRKNDLPPGSSVGLVLILWAALLCAALAWALSASVAPAQTVKEWIADNHSAAPSRSYVEIHEPHAPGAVASVTFSKAEREGERELWPQEKAIRDAAEARRRGM